MPLLLEALDSSGRSDSASVAKVRSLTLTNIIENPNGAVRRVTHRACRWRDARGPSAGSGWFPGGDCFSDIQGHRDLWILSQALIRESKMSVANRRKPLNLLPPTRRLFPSYGSTSP